WLNIRMYLTLGSNTFDARLIISQIIIVQPLHYISLGVVITLFDLIFGYQISLYQFFSYKTFTIYESYGRITITSWLINAVIEYVILQSTKTLSVGFHYSLLYKDQKSVLIFQ